MEQQAEIWLDFVTSCPISSLSFPVTNQLETTQDAVNSRICSNLDWALQLSGTRKDSGSIETSMVAFE